MTATDADGDALTYAWDLDGNGTVDSTVQKPAFRYETAGTYTAKVTVSDGKLTAERTVTVTVEGAAVTQPVADRQRRGADAGPDARRRHPARRRSCRAWTATTRRR